MLWLKKTPSVVMLFILVSLLLIGCAERTRGLKVAGDWSRGVQVGQVDQMGTIAPVALAVAPGGDLIFLTWPVETGADEHTLHLTILDQKGVPLVDRSLDLKAALASGNPAQPQLTISADGSSLLLTWIDENETSPGLYHVRLATDGAALSPAYRLSPQDFGVKSYQVAPLTGGDFLIVWADREGISAVQVSPDGAATQPANLSRQSVSRLGCQVDHSGVAHLAWQEGPSSVQRQIYYATLDANVSTFSTPTRLATEVVYDWLHGPVVALERGEPDRVYVGWTRATRRAAAGGVIQEHTAFYLSFRQGEPGPQTPSRVNVSPWFPPAYAPVSSEFSYQHLAPAYPDDWAGASADFYLSPAALTGKAAEAVWGLSMYARTQWGQQIQPALLVFDEGRLKGYQLAAWTAQQSWQPAVAADAQGNLYLAWLEMLGRQKGTFVYLASTAPVLRAAWDRPTTNDWRIELERISTRLVAAVGLALALVIWVVLPIVWIFFALFVLRTTSLVESKGRVVFLGAFILHWATKYLLIPGESTRLPSLGYLPLISPLLAQLAPNLVFRLAQSAPPPAWVGFLVPCLTMAIALTVVHWVYLRWKKEPSALVAYLLFGLIDSFIALETYTLTYYDPMRF
jgi:hypothetical protein